MIETTRSATRPATDRDISSIRERGIVGRPGSATSLMIANLASAGAAVLMSTALAAHLDGTTGSATWAAAAIILAELPPLLVGTHLGACIDRLLNRRLLLAAEGLTCLSSIFCGVAADLCSPPAVVLGGIGLRSILVASVRNSLLKWLKLETPPQRQSRAGQVFALTILLALPLSGLALWVVPRISSRQMAGVIAISLGLHLCAMTFMSRLPASPRATEVPRANRPDRRSRGLIATVHQIAADPQLSPYFFTILFTQSIFQAAEAVFVPTKGQSLGPGGSAWMQTFGGIGLLAGLAALWLLEARVARGLALPIVTFGLGCMLGSANAGSIGVALPAFLGMTFSYEILDTYCFSRFFERAPGPEAARYAIGLGTLASAMMSLWALCLGASIDVLGFARASYVYAAIALAYGLLLFGLHRWCLREARASAIHARPLSGDLSP